MGGMGINWLRMGEDENFTTESQRDGGRTEFFDRRREDVN